jgi:SAM-dependent methyltransferase
MEQKCLLCQSSTYRIYDPKLDRTYHRCTMCDFIFKDSSQHLSALDELGRYELHNNVIEDVGYYNFLNSFFRDYVLPFMKPNHIGLDYGCGPNPVLQEIVKKEYQIQLDVYDKYYAQDESIWHKQYDFIVSTEVFEHFRDPSSDISRVIDLLIPNGILSIMTSLHPEDDQAFFKWHYARDDTHISIYGKKTIDYLCQRFQLKLISSDNRRCFTFLKMQNTT